MRRLMVMLVALGVMAAGAAQAALTCPAANSVAARSSGTAPLFVFFDASGSNGQYGANVWNQDSTLVATANQSFRDLHFTWNFNDPNSGIWGDQGVGYADGKSRNAADGPLAAHLFETPGTYQPVLTITNTAGNSCSVVLSMITVADPNTTWSGSATMCIGNSMPAAGSGGCPSGATVYAATVFETAMSHAIGAKATRILFKGGDTFTTNATTGNTAYTMNTPGPGYVGSFGTGQATVTQGSQELSGLLNFNASATDWRVVRMTWTGTSNNVAGDDFAVGATGQFSSRILILRNNCPASWSQCVQFNDYASGGDGTHDQVGIIENTIVGPSSSPNSPTYGMYIGIHHGAAIANKIDLSADTQYSTGHAIRVPCAKSGLISHNYGYGGKGTGLTIHSSNVGGGQQCAGSGGTAGGSFFFDVSDNVWTAPSTVGANTVVSIAPQNNTNVEYVHDGIEERDFITMDNTGGGYEPVYIDAQRLTLRNNILNVVHMGTGGWGIHIKQEISPVNPVDVQVYNNSGIWKGLGSDFGGGASFILSDGNSQNIVIRNNLSYDLTGRGFTITCGGSNCGVDHNLAASAIPFVSSAPAVATDFRLLSGSAAVGAGAAIGEPANVPVLNDFGLAMRPAIMSVGAWQLTGAAALGPPGQPSLVP